MFKICSRSSLLVGKTVADAGDGEDEVGRGGVQLNFAAQLADVDVQIVRV